ncbi:hypothetical protein [Gilvimarinus algae]|uniref:Uncharacterized protein n=1 Tax=Gilvimarinus algae TaxID=3058037 RepID=A0ABT8TAR8_9GAMM|nr:hypothetical protein [Gilvimarinus sp. SDUM040014]MDO3381211.1 hypothetical protein [Gilvimarinus sp. SDUM040014]
MLYLSSGLLVLIGFAHSYLGERYILIRLFRREDLPRLFGGDDFTKRTLRFAWHITTLCWWGFAAILLLLARGEASPDVIGLIVGVTFTLHFLVALIGSRGKHLSWIVFLAVALLAVFASLNVSL